MPYDEIDGDDDDLVVGRLPALLLFGPFGARRGARDGADARNSALRKLNAVLREHDLDELSFRDFVRAFRIFVGLVKRRAREKAKRRLELAKDLRDAERELEEVSNMAAARGEGSSMHSRGDEDASAQTAASLSSASDSSNSKQTNSSNSCVPLSETPLRPPTLSLPQDVVPSMSVEDGSGLLSARHRRFVSISSLASRASRSVAHSSHFQYFPRRRTQSVDSATSAPADQSFSRVIRHRDAPASPNPRLAPEHHITGDHVAVLHHMLRHAESIYGLPLNAASGPATAMRGFTDKNIVIRRTGIDEDGLLCAKFRSDAFLPAHYVAVDRRVRAIVVCLRGTANLIDSLTDVAATLDPLNIVSSSAVADFNAAAGGAAAGADQGLDGESRREVPLVCGHGHAGVLRSARALFARVSPVVLEGLAANPGYDVLITGHSLGGAVGAVVALIMREDPRFPRARAICIGPPPCVSKEIAEDANDTVVSLVNGADIVPRLSVQTLNPYFTTCRYVAALGSMQKRAIDVGLSRAAVDWDELMALSRREQEEKREELKSKQLYVPGVVLQLVEPKDVKRLDAALLHLYGDVKVDIIRVPRTDFARLRRERGMFLSHAPHRYRANLMAALKSCGGTPLRRTANTGGLLNALARLPTSQVLAAVNYDDSGVSGEDDQGGRRSSRQRQSSIDTRKIEFL